MSYIKIKQGLKDKGTLIPIDKKQEFIDNAPDIDLYESIYVYNDEHKKKFDETGSTAGIRDVTTKKLFWDFDNKNDPGKALKDANKLVGRLKENGFYESDIQAYFSGSKGATIIIEQNQNLTPQQVQSICVDKFGKDLETLDTGIYDAARVLRIPYTMHQGSGMRKIPISHDLLESGDMDKIRQMASSDEIDVYEYTTSSKDVREFVVKEEKKEDKRIVGMTQFDINNIDWSNKNKDWKDYKWALLQGYFKEGDRHNALMVIAATCRALNYDKETTYYMCKAALKKQARMTGQPEFEKEELYTNIIEQSVFGTNWNGGQYSIVSSAFLKKYCHEMGFTQEGNKFDEKSTHAIADVHEIFKDYASNLDKLTIKFGIPDLDRKMRATVGMSIGLIAAPGTGKTSIALAALNFMSKSGELCIFFSYDMYHAIVYQKLLQKHFNITMDEALLKLTGVKTVYKEDPEYQTLKKSNRKILEQTNYVATFDFSDKKEQGFEEKVRNKLKEEYANVEFCFTSGQSIEDISETIKDVERKRGQKVRFIAVDYNELIQTDISDSTASSNYVAQKIREIAIVHSVCALQLFQPTKITGNPADEIKSYHAAKGGGGLSQSVSIMLTMSRPGYSPDKPEEDRYARINCVKNRMGPLFKIDLGFHGLTGNFTTLSEEERTELNNIINRKEQEREAAAEGGGW